MNQLPLICVCGAGTMGTGIAQTFAQYRYTTVLFDVNREMLNRAQSNVTTNLRMLEEKQKISAEDTANILSSIRFTTDINECHGDLIIEAIIENEEAKVDLLKQLANINDTDTIFATNTSSLAVTAISKHLQHPQHFAGMHFFNPAPVMKLVELVRTPETNDKTINFLSGIVISLGKTAVICNDSPGFIVNRVARPYYLEALRLAESGIAPETIDQLMENTGFKMGPFRLMDLIGNDINYSVSCTLYEALGNPPRLQPSAIQQQKVQEGSLGRKTGKGYYEYPAKS